MSATLETAAPQTPPSEVGLRGERMPHLLGLDGLRGLAVIGVLLFHGGFTWAKGGFLGVSTFFTLSGFLITNLLVREFDTAQHASPSAGSGPAASAASCPPPSWPSPWSASCWWRIGSPEQLDGLRADMLGALAYVANWRFYFAGTSYADLFAAPSPLQHFWSLAIEEQFYLFFPPIVWGVMKVGGRRLLTWLLVVSPGRLGRARAVARRQHRPRLLRHRHPGGRAALRLPPGGVVVGTARPRRPSSRPSGLRRRPHPHRGGRRRSAPWRCSTMFGAWVLVDADLDQALPRRLPRLRPAAPRSSSTPPPGPGLVSKFLSIPFLRWAGLISYGLYLYHWPIFLFLDEERTGLSTTPLFVVRMAVTLVIALASYFLLEQPIRRGTMIKTGRQLIVAGRRRRRRGGRGRLRRHPRPAPEPDPLRRPAARATSTVPPSTRAAPTARSCRSPARRPPSCCSATPAPSTPPRPSAPCSGPPARRTSSRRRSPGWGLTQPGVDLRDLDRARPASSPRTSYVMMAGLLGPGLPRRERRGRLRGRCSTTPCSQLTADGAKVLWIGMVPGGKNIDRPVNDVARAGGRGAIPTRSPTSSSTTSLAAARRRHRGRGREGQRAVAPLVLDRRRHGRAAAQARRLALLPGRCRARSAWPINAAGVAAGWMPDADPPGSTATWRTDERYDDPEGGCTARVATTLARSATPGARTEPRRARPVARSEPGTRTSHGRDGGSAGGVRTP